MDLDARESDIEALNQKVSQLRDQLQSTVGSNSSGSSVGGTMTSCNSGLSLMPNFDSLAAGDAEDNVLREGSVMQSCFKY